MAINLIKITAYVRTEDDLQLWKALPNKTEAIHQMLQASKGVPQSDATTHNYDANPQQKASDYTKVRE